MKKLEVHQDRHDDLSRLANTDIIGYEPALTGEDPLEALNDADELMVAGVELALFVVRDGRIMPPPYTVREAPGGE